MKQAPFTSLKLPQDVLFTQSTTTSRKAPRFQAAPLHQNLNTALHRCWSPTLVTTFYMTETMSKYSELEWFRCHNHADLAVLTKCILVAAEQTLVNWSLLSIFFSCFLEYEGQTLPHVGGISSGNTQMEIIWTHMNFLADEWACN